MSEDEKNIRAKISEIESEAWKLNSIHYIKSRELEILRAAKQLLEHNRSWSPFLNPEIMDKDFLDRKIKEYSEEVERLERRIHKLYLEREKLINQLMGRRGE